MKTWIGKKDGSFEQTDILKLIEENERLKADRERLIEACKLGLSQNRADLEEMRNNGEQENSMNIQAVRKAVQVFKNAIEQAERGIK